MNNVIILRTELINLFLNETIDELKLYVDDNLELLKSLKMDGNLIYHVLVKIIRSVVSGKVDAVKLGEGLSYIFEVLEFDNTDCISYGKLKVDIENAENLPQHEIDLLVDLYRQVVSLNIHEILLENDLYALAVLLSSDYHNICNNLEEILSYTNRLKKIEECPEGI